MTTGRPQKGKRLNTIALGGTVVIALYFTILAVLADTDLALGRHVLFIDELISFDGVRHLLHPENGADFVYYLFDGNDHRYGRILWNFSALFSVVPERIFGEPGQIIATRLALYCALLAAYVIISLTFLTSWRYRFLAVLLLLSIPSTQYYASMPKPEPLQLLFLAFFLWQAKKHDFGFGPHWLFLGLAFGAKISVLPIIPLFAALAVIPWFRQPRREQQWRKPFTATCTFAAGFLIGEPLNLVSIYMRSLEPTYYYINETFRNTRHGADNPAVSWQDWLTFVLEKYTTVPKPVLIIAALVILILFLCAVTEVWRGGSGETPSALHDALTRHTGLILFCAGILLTLPIIIMVKRMWGFYLHNGMVMLGIGTLAMAETYLPALTNFRHEVRITSIVSATTALMIALMTILFLAPQSTRGFLDLSRRTESPEFKRQYDEYRHITTLLSILSRGVGRPATYILDADMMDIGTTAFHQGSTFCGPFIGWPAGADTVIEYTDPHVRGTELPEPTNIEYQKAMLEKVLFERHVAPDATQCTATPCYVRLETYGEVSIFVRSDLMPLAAAMLTFPQMQR